MFHFYTPWKHQKTSGFLMFSGGIEVEQWLKMGYLIWFLSIFSALTSFKKGQGRNSSIALLKMDFSLNWETWYCTNFKKALIFKKISAFCFLFKLLPSRNLLVQREQSNFLNNDWNLFEVNNKDIRTTSMMLFSCLYLLLTLNRFHKLFLGFQCSLWTCKCRLGRHLTFCKNNQTTNNKTADCRTAFCDTTRVPLLRTRVLRVRQPSSGMDAVTWVFWCLKKQPPEVFY